MRGLQSFLVVSFLFPGAMACGDSDDGYPTDDSDTEGSDAEDEGDQADESGNSDDDEEDSAGESGSGGADSSDAGDPDGSEDAGDESSDDADDSQDDGTEDTADSGDEDDSGDSGGDSGADDSGDSGTDDGGTDEGCPVMGDLGPGDHTRMLMHGGLNRSYIVHVPTNYDPSQRTPTLFNIHGLMSNASQQVGLSNMNPTSDAQGYIVVYPEGQQSSWNAGSCCGGASSSNLDDTGFLKAVAADVQEVLCVDSRRIYAIGMSNGGYMSHRLACEANDVFAAFAPVAGAMGIPDCTPARPVPILAFHGVQDTLVAYSAGQTAMMEWAEHNGCGSSTITEVESDVSCERWEDCDDGAVVEFCTLDPMGHCWPGGGETPYCLPFIGPYNDYVANTHILEFLSSYTLP